jgi:AraC-like DNA-binding protein
MGETMANMFERLDSGIDVLTQVLDAAHLGGAMSAVTELGAPWALHFRANGAPRAGFHVVAKGTCLTTLDNTDDQVALGEGDLVLFPHGTGHTLRDAVGPPAVEFARLVDDTQPAERVKFRFGGSGATTILLCGAYSLSAQGTSLLLRGLPDMIRIPADQARDTALEPAINLLVTESSGLEPGSGLVVDRLVDLLFVYALRTWFSHQDRTTKQCWFAALQDPIVGPSVRAVHKDLARAWTVAELAQRSGLSRAPFARRFREALGEPPLAYVARWRMTVAADLLERGEPIGSVAHQVGYENEFAFAKAFKRLRGIAPGQYRRRHSHRRVTSSSEAVP